VIVKRRLIVDPRVDGQLDRAYLWWARNRSPEQAGRWYRSISVRINALVSTAGRYALAPENDRFSYEIRQMLVGLGRRPTHRVLFTIRSDSVYVLAVRHVSQRLLKPEDLAK
jgi:plasmid stabilization system protein ParE